jgi:hypothetical protein
MNFKSSVKMTGALTVKKLLGDELISEIHVPNLVVTIGKAHIAKRLGTATESIMTHMSVGTGLTVSALNDTTLVAELNRVELTSTLVTGSNITYTAVFLPGIATGSITEAGVFNDDVGGTMLCRTTFPVITKSAAETVAISWTVTVG